MLVVLTVWTVESPVWPCVCAVVAVVGTLLHIDWAGVEVEVVSEISASAASLAELTTQCLVNHL